VRIAKANIPMVATQFARAVDVFTILGRLSFTARPSLEAGQDATAKASAILTFAGTKNALILGRLVEMALDVVMTVTAKVAVASPI
jgi:hypothetical protein